MLVENKYFLNDRYIFDANNKSLIDQDNEDDITWLGNNESNILLAFISRPKEVLSRDKIHELVWTSNGFHVDESSVIQAISTVRKILKDSAKEPTFIKTIPKHGYQFIATSRKVENDITNDREYLPVDNETKAKGILGDNAVPEKTKSTIMDNLLINTALPLLILLSCLIWIVNSISMKTTTLYEIDRISGIPVVSLSQATGQHFSYPLASQCVTQYLNETNSKNGVNRVIVNFNSTDELILNIVHMVPRKSVSYNIVASESEMVAFCKKVF